MNVFQGGFLSLDNIGVFDRSAPLPTGGHIEQSDGTAWMDTGSGVGANHQTGWTGLVAKLLTQSGEAEAAPEKAAAKTANC